jgi:hypothetical protein
LFLKKLLILFFTDFGKTIVIAKKKRNIPLGMKSSLDKIEMNNERFEKKSKNI